MKLSDLYLGDFTCYKDSTFHFESTVNLIVGENASGKTSILDALTYLLTGACARTDKAGHGADAMVRAGAKDAAIAAIITNNGDVLNFGRKIPGGLWIDGHDGTATALQEYLCECLGANSQVVTAALSTHEFLDVSHDSQKRLLFGLLGLSFERKEISELIAKEVSISLKTVTGEMLDAAPDPLFDGTGQTFSRLHKHFYDLRRNAKRRLKDLGAPPEVELGDTLPPLAGVEEQLAGLREELYTARAKHAALSGALERSERINGEIRNLKDARSTLK